MARLLWPVAMIRLAQTIRPLLVDLVVVDQRAARRFGHADAFQVVDVGVGADVRDQDVRLVRASARSARGRTGSRSGGRSGSGRS